jgi:hypothetical protein
MSDSENVSVTISSVKSSFIYLSNMVVIISVTISHVQASAQRMSENVVFRYV